MATRKYGEVAGTATSFDPLEPGWYDTEITASEYRKANTGADMYHTEFTVEDGPNANSKVWTNLTINWTSAKSQSFFMGTMKTLGLDRDWFTKNVGNVKEGDESAEDEAHATIVQALIGKRCRVLTEHKEYKSKVSDEVVRIASPTSGGGKKDKAPKDDGGLPSAKPKKTTEEKAAKAAKKAKKAAAAAEATEPDSNPSTVEEKPAKVKKAKAPKGKPELPPGLGA